MILLSCAFKQTQLCILMNSSILPELTSKVTNGINGIQVSQWHLPSLSVECKKMLPRSRSCGCMSTQPPPSPPSLHQIRHRKADILLVVNGTFSGPTGAHDVQDLSRQRVFLEPNKSCQSEVQAFQGKVP